MKMKVLDESDEAEQNSPPFLICCSMVSWGKSNQTKRSKLIEVSQAWWLIEAHI